MLFRCDNVGKEFSGTWLFRGVSAQCNPGDKIGLIGGNGTGKTTLFSLVDGRLSPDEGQVTKSSHSTISRIDQITALDPEKPVYHTALQVFDNLKQLANKLSTLEHEIADSADEIGKPEAEQYERLQTQFRLQGGYDYEARTEKVLFGLGFTHHDLQSPSGNLSGGQQSRLRLASALLRPAELLLLDEPTNHLDLHGILWLANYLQDYRSALVLISHDRQFLDTVTNFTWEIEAGRLHRYAAGFSASRRLREERRRLQQQEYEQQQDWKHKTEDFVRRNIAGQKTKQAQARRKRLKSTDWLERPVDDEFRPRVRIPEASRGGALSCEISHGVIGFEGHPLINNVHLRVMRGEKIGLLGGNGSGKTTLLRTILGEIRALDGQLEWGSNNVPAYFAQETVRGDEGETVLDYLAKVTPTWTDLEIRKFAAAFLFRADDVHKEVGMLSGGERSRLSLARLFSRPSNVLMLDEPTNHLDIRSREALEEAIRRFGGTAFVISHDLYFLRNVVERFFLITDGALQSLDRVESLLTQSPEPLIPANRPPRESPAPKRKTTPGLSKNERMRTEKELRRLETAIDEFEAEQVQIQHQLQQGTQDHLHLTELAKRHEEIETQLARLLEEWTMISHELRERSEPHDVTEGDAR